MRLSFPFFRRSLRPAARRRGFTITEVTMASFIVVLVFSSVAGVLSLSGRMLQTVSIQDETSQAAVKAMSRIADDVREAKEIVLVSSSQIRIYYPTTDANGRYYRFQTNNNYYIEYARTTSAGTVSATGAYLWRKTNTTTGKALIPDVSVFTVTAPSGNTLNVALTVQKTLGNRTGQTAVSQRLQYLRNY